LSLGLNWLFREREERIVGETGFVVNVRTTYGSIRFSFFAPFGRGLGRGITRASTEKYFFVIECLPLTLDAASKDRQTKKDVLAYKPSSPALFPKGEGRKLLSSTAVSLS